MGKRSSEVVAEVEVDPKAAKKARKAAAAAAAAAAETVELEEPDAEAEALAAKKAAKKAKKAAAAAAAVLEAAEPVAEEEDEDAAAAALAAKKAAKKAKKAAAAAAAVAVAAEEDVQMTPKEEATPKPEAKKAEKKAEPAKDTAADDEEFKDNTYKCCDCDGDWVDTADDQQFRWDKGFAETPRRCKDCRWAKKVRMEGGDPTAKGKAKGKGKSGGDENTVFVRGLPFSCTEESLTKDFADCGELVSLRMPLNDEGSCRGIAFIKYTSKEGMDKAMAFNETDYGGRTIFCSDAAIKPEGKGKGKDGKGKGKDGKGKGKGKDKGKSKGPGPKPAGCTSVVVKGLSYEATDVDLQKVFGKCGSGPTNVKLLTDRETGESRGMAFVDFDDEKAVGEAMKLSETELKGRKFYMDYSKPREW